MVYVISKDNKPLMPCTNVIARLLLKQGKAKVKEKCPFTIPDSVTKIVSSAFYNVPHVYYNGKATGSPWGAKAIN